MIHHIVMWKLKETANGKSKAENAQLMKDRLEGLKEILPEIIELRVGMNIENEYSNFDIVLHSYFKTMEDYFIYQKHPEHEAIGNWVFTIREERFCVDYEF